MVDAHCDVDLLERKRVRIGDCDYLLTMDNKKLAFGGAIPNFCYPLVYMRNVGQVTPPSHTIISGSGHGPQLVQLDPGLLAKRVKLMVRFPRLRSASFSF